MADAGIRTSELWFCSRMLNGQDRAEGKLQKYAEIHRTHIFFPLAFEDLRRPGYLTEQLL